LSEAKDLLVAQLTPPAGEPTQFDKVIQAMYATGDLVAILDPPLSQVILDMRGPKQ
jgi:hypothetical protein